MFEEISWHSPSSLAEHLQPAASACENCSGFHAVPPALMRLPTACSVRQAQLTSLWVATVFHK